MLRLAMPHAGFNPDGAIKYPEQSRPTQAEPSVTTYDWMFEMLGQDSSQGWVREKIGMHGWRVGAFENYKKYILSEYETLNPRALYSAWLSNGFLPVWDRTNDSATTPVGWFDVKTQSYHRGGQEELLHEDRPDQKPEVSLVTAWLRKQCRFGS